MNRARSGILVVCLLFCLLENKTLSMCRPEVAEITALNPEIRIGGPLIIKVRYRLAEPCVDVETGQIRGGIRAVAWPLFEVKDRDRAWISGYPDAELLKPDGQEAEYYGLSQLYPAGAGMEDANELWYSVHHVIGYNRWKGGPIFDQPGPYKVCIMTQEALWSNIIEVRVSAEIAQEECVLPDSNTYNFLVGVDERSQVCRAKMMSHLEALVEECPDSVLAKWAAARLGLECFDDADKQKYKARREKRTVDVAIWENARRHLEKGWQLPDDFFIRYAVLGRLVEIEYAREDYSKALLYVDELLAKYPKGRHGKKAAKYRKEILRLRDSGS